MQQSVDVECRQIDYLNVVEFVQECLWGYADYYAQIAHEVQFCVVLEWEFFEHIALEVFEIIFELIAFFS